MSLRLSGVDRYDTVPADFAERGPNVLGLDEAREIVLALGRHESVLLLSSPGVGKTDLVHSIADELGLPCRSLLGTQLAPEDVSGLPRLVDERTVFCPPRLLAPVDGQPFVLFLDELPAAAPEVQKAFYSLLLERRVGEHPLPPGTLVVAAGNRSSDRALVRSLSSALVNRVFVIEVEARLDPWLAWSARAGVRSDVRAFLTMRPEALSRAAPDTPGPFSTPRAWASLSRALDLAEARGALRPELRRVLAFGRVSPADAELFAAWEAIGEVEVRRWFEDGEIELHDTLAWLRLDTIRRALACGGLAGVPTERVRTLLASLPREAQRALYVGLEAEWRARGVGELLQCVPPGARPGEG